MDVWIYEDGWTMSWILKSPDKAMVKSLDLEPFLTIFIKKYIILIVPYYKFILVCLKILYQLSVFNPKEYTLGTHLDPKTNYLFNFFRYFQA